MNIIRIFSIALCAASLLTIQACKKEVEVKTDSNGTTTVTDSTKATGVGQEIKDETVEKKVEAALIAEPGFGDVDVSSAPDGMIILTGTVPTENEKARAQVIAQNVGGVKGVTNNITLKP